jgi:hypothetical protein
MPTRRLVDQTKNKADAGLGNRSQHIVFIPWPWGEADEWVDKTSQWNFVSGGKYQIVVWDLVLKDPFIQQATHDPQAVIYIRGHGAAGLPNIQVKVNTGTGVEERKIHITTACDRLIGSGLGKQFSGAIKFFHCYSATVLEAAAHQNEVTRVGSWNKMIKDGHRDGTLTRQERDQRLLQSYDNKSIARTGADYMRSKGYKRCVYYGYLGPLESEMADDGTGTWHKQCNLADLQSPGFGVGTVRASLGRVQV